MSDVRTFLKPYKKLIEKALKYNPGTHKSSKFAKIIKRENILKT